jgi:hypothetical protein
MIFPTLEIEAVVQVGDRTRLDASKTYASKDGPVIASVEIEPEAAAGYIDVTGTKPADWLTDWEYQTAGTKTVTVQINGLGIPVIRTATISVLTAVDDALFTADSDLIQEEPDILRYVRRGRNTFKDVHRQAQTMIMQMLDRKGYRDTSGAKLTKTAVVDKTEVSEMSRYLVLSLIFKAQSNQVGDVHELKAKAYMSLYELATQRQIIGLDIDGDGEVMPAEGASMRDCVLTRR